MQELAGRAVRLDDAAVVVVVGDVAARAAGHEDLDARLLPFSSRSTRRPRSAARIAAISPAAAAPMITAS